MGTFCCCAVSRLMVTLGEPDREMARWKSPTEAGEDISAKMLVPVQAVALARMMNVRSYGMWMIWDVLGHFSNRSQERGSVREQSGGVLFDSDTLFVRLDINPNQHQMQFAR